MDTMLSKALREFLSGQLNQLIVNLAGENGAQVEEEFKKFNRGEPCNIGGMKAKSKEKVWPSITRPVPEIPVLTLEATKGQMPLEELQKVFPAGINGFFEHFPSIPTKEMKSVVHQQTVDGNCRSIFKGISIKLKSLVFSPRQIADFCVKNPQWLRTGGHATIFLMEKDEDYFVAYVNMSASGLKVGVRPFSHEDVCYAKSRHRFVIPQPETLVA